MKISIEALIDAPIETVWHAFNDPAEILKWDISPDWRTIQVSNDLRVGGRLQLRLQPHDGPGFDYRVTYTRVEPMRLIEWRTDDHHIVRVEFRDIAAGVVVTQTFHAEPTPSPDEQRRDWQGVLDNFARHIVAMAG